MEELECWVWLQSALGAGSSKLNLLLEKFGGAPQVFGAGRQDFILTEGLTKREIEALSDKSLEKSRRIIEECRKENYRILAKDDPFYPPMLRTIYAPPAVLYVAGELENDPDRLFISVVGTRKITEYGCEAATKLSMGLARAGTVIVSGLAHGVDGAAHRGALKAGGKTVAVLGCGIDYNYPASHAELKRLIVKNGAVISEYPPGTRPDKANFPTRNRIIAGLSQGTVVIEAGSRSGALITASLATEMGRDVFAVPGSIFSEMSEGPNKLIRDGAKPVCTCLDILEEYPGSFLHTINRNEPADEAPENGVYENLTLEGMDVSPKKQEKKNPEKEKPAGKSARAGMPAGLSTAQEKVYAVLNEAEKPEHVDELALRANLELRVVLAALTSLEIQGLVRSLPGRYYTRA